MSRKDKNPEDSEDVSELTDGGLGLPISRPFRLIAAGVLSITLTACVSIIVGYLVMEKPQWEPAKFDLISLVIFCFLGVAVCLLPWERYRVDVRKIGPFEFRQALSTQAEERESELAEVWKRIKELEQLIPQEHAGETDSQNKQPNFLTEHLQGFLANNETVAYSPLRIKNLQKETFGLYDTSDIRGALRGMVADGTVETKVSKKGNTLFRISKMEG